MRGSLESSSDDVQDNHHPSEEIFMTTRFRKEAATYFAGAMAWHALTHLALAALKSEEPHKRLGITMTPARNAAAAAVWAGVAVALARYARTDQHTLPAP